MLSIPAMLLTCDEKEQRPPLLRATYHDAGMLNMRMNAADGQRLVQLAALSDSLDYIADAIAQSGEQRSTGNDLQVNMPLSGTQQSMSDAKNIGYGPLKPDEHCRMGCPAQANAARLA